MWQRDAVSLSSLLRICSTNRLGKQIHAQILVHGFLPHVTLQTDLLLMYSKCSSLTDARQIFDEMPTRNMYSWNILISSYVHNRLHIEALHIFNGLLSVGLRPDHFTFPSLFKACTGIGGYSLGKIFHNLVVRLGFEDQIIVRSSILDMYAKFGSFGDAYQLLVDKLLRDVVVWNSIISGLGRAGFSIQALDCFRKMQVEGVKMDSMTIPSILNVCGREGDLMKGKEMHGQVVKCVTFSFDVAIGNSLIDMYGKCGCLEHLGRVFANMCNWNLVTWTTMISCYGIHGKGEESLILFENMRILGFTPNSITFTALLASCSHSGLIDQGQRIFKSMSTDYGVEPTVEHYACMVDLLGRFGHLDEALQLIKKMPLEPTASVWGALLAASRMHKNVEHGEVSAYQLFELESGNSSNYIALSSIYDAVGRLDGVLRIRSRMRELGLAKTPGCSRITVKGRVHRFYQGDASHLRIRKMQVMLDTILKSSILCDDYG